MVVSNGDHEDNEEQEDEQFDTDSSGRTESEDISKQWIDYKEGHILER